MMACINLLSRLQSLKTNGTLLTIMLCSVICLSQFQHGVEIGYLDFAVEDIDSEKNPFYVLPSEQSWLNSVALFGSMAGAVLSAPLLDKLGRQQVLLASCLPSAIGWLVITSAGSINTMYAGRVIVGLAQGLAAGAALIYLIEIARPDIRGAISLFSMMGVALGKLFVYVIGALIPYNWTSVIMIGLTLVVTVGLTFFPDSQKYRLLQDQKNAQLTTNISSEGTTQIINGTEYLELENLPGCSTDDVTDLAQNVSNAIGSEEIVENASKNDNVILKTETENELLKEIVIESRNVEDEILNGRSSNIQNDTNSFRKIPIQVFQNFGRRVIQSGLNLVLKKVSTENAKGASEIPNSSDKTNNETSNFDEREASLTESMSESPLTLADNCSFQSEVAKHESLTEKDEQFGFGSVLKSTEKIFESDLQTLGGVVNSEINGYSVTNGASSSLASDPLETVTGRALSSANTERLKTGLGGTISSIFSGTINKAVRGTRNKMKTIVDDALNSSAEDAFNSESNVTDGGLNSQISDVLNLKVENASNSGTGDAEKSAAEKALNSVMGSEDVGQSDLGSALKKGIGETVISIILGTVNKIVSGLSNSGVESRLNSAVSDSLNIGNVENEGALNEVVGGALNPISVATSSTSTDYALHLATEGDSVLNSGLDGSSKLISSEVNKVVGGGFLNSETTIASNLKNISTSIINEGVSNALNLTLEGEGALIGTALKSGIDAALNLGDLNLKRGDGFNSIVSCALGTGAVSAIGSVVSGATIPMVDGIGGMFNFGSGNTISSETGTGTPLSSVTADQLDLSTGAGLNSFTEQPLVDMATNETNEFVNQAINNVAGEALSSVPGGEVIGGLIEKAANSVIGRGIGTIVEKAKQADDKYAGGKFQVVTSEAVKIVKKVGPAKVLQLVRGENSNEHDQNDIELNLKMLNQPVPWNELFKKKIAMYLGCCIFMQIVSSMGGVVILNQYSVTIFNVSRTNMDSNQQTIFLAVINVVFTIVCSFTIDLISRRRVALISLSSECFFMTTLGIFFYINNCGNHAWAEKYIFWLPLVSFIMFQIFLIWSDATIFVMSTELFSTDLRGRVSPIVLTCRQLFLFFGSKGVLEMIKLIGLYGGFWVCAGINLAGGIFYVFLVPETAKKSLEQIQSDLHQESSEA